MNVRNRALAHNPYQPPKSAGAPREFLRPPASATVPIIVYLLAAVAYHGFIGLLLNSTPGDWNAGCLLLTNSPTILVWGFSILRLRRLWLIGGIAVCGVQCLLAGVMFFFEMGDPEAILIFLAITLAAYCAVLLVCWWNARRIANVINSERSSVLSPASALE